MNNTERNLENVESLTNSPLKGKRIAFLGSSITYGSGSNGVSFVEYIAKRNDCTCVKEAVSGTTLVENTPESYIKRLRTMDVNEKFDIFVCQLSTNDAAQNMPLGDIDDNDTSTVTGAIRYIYKYVQDKWGCPLVIYASAYYKNDNYKKMVKRVKEMNYINLIDMYSDVNFNNITTEQRKLYMLDGVHPTQAGYLEWWTPYIEEALYKIT